MVSRMMRACTPAPRPSLVAYLFDADQRGGIRREWRRKTATPPCVLVSLG